MFKNNIYIKMYKNKITARNVDSGVEVTELANPSFTTQRLLVGDFTAAEFAIKSLLKKVTPAGWFTISPKILIHAMEMTEGGLSQIEERALCEVAKVAGARMVKVCTGAPLSDEAVLQLLTKAKPK